MSATGPTHLVVFQHGLHGSETAGQTFGEMLTGTHTNILYHTAKCNAGAWMNRVIMAPTARGVDVCGRDLADEILQVVSQHPSLQEISIIGFSLGGLITRYAIGVLYSPSTNTIAGLKPREYITFASPHFGVRTTLPYVMSALAYVFVDRTYEHLSMADGKGDQPPLLVRMAQSGSELPFLEGLRAFQRRTCLGNVQFDLQVPYPTATICPHAAEKWTDPLFPAYPHIMAVFSDPPGAFCHEKFAHLETGEPQPIPDLEAMKAFHKVQSDINLSTHSAVSQSLGNDPEVGKSIHRTVSQRQMSEAGPSAAAVAQAFLAVDENSYEGIIVRGLRETMGWRRVAVRFWGVDGMLCHDNIVVCKPFLSLVGKDVLQFVIDTCF
eukprot:comp77966_c0_seq1/m.48302 comp77966_c0_seq1/g.48302  ORF comp77966_c0_seq1/g.48302 comp77966_c0_seq1/m.48302 type:complete len:380 (-) comp77966_c0_seq1:107-1246(-)